jgi:hypothetical protein
MVEENREETEAILQGQALDNSTQIKELEIMITKLNKNHSKLGEILNRPEIFRLDFILKLRKRTLTKRNETIGHILDRK